MFYNGLIQAPFRAVVWPFLSHPRRTCQKGRGAVVLFNSVKFKDSTFSCLEIKDNIAQNITTVRSEYSKYCGIRNMLGE